MNYCYILPLLSRHLAPQLAPQRGVTNRLNYKHTVLLRCSCIIAALCLASCARSEKPPALGQALPASELPTSALPASVVPAPAQPISAETELPLPQTSSRLLPPAPDSRTPAVSNELIVADNVLNQNLTPAEKTENNTPTQNHTVDSANNIQRLADLSSAGDTDAQVALADAYATGQQVEKSSTEANRLYRLAASQNNDIAQYKLGLQYFHGNGVDTDYAIAREWWLEAATRGNADAQQSLGYLYSEALGVERDYNRAIIWYTRAGNLGHAEAQTLLGSLYHEGNRIPHNYTKAFKWYKLAAERGHPHAQYTLATLYHDGYGTDQDFVKCTAWIDVALANGYKDQLNARQECSKHLDATEHNQAATLASRWKTGFLQRSDYN